MTFSRDRLNDMFSVGFPAPAGYERKRWTEGNIEYYDDMWGNVWQRLVGGCAGGEIWRPAITDWAQLKDFRAPTFNLAACTAELRTRLAEAGDRFRVVGVGGWIFADARYLRKLEVYLQDLALFPDELRRLHRLICGVYETKIRAAGEAGADAIMFCETWGRRRVCFLVRRCGGSISRRNTGGCLPWRMKNGLKVLMHSCGKNDAIVPDLLKAGVNCFQFDQPTVYDQEWLATQLATSGRPCGRRWTFKPFCRRGIGNSSKAGARTMPKFQRRLHRQELRDLPGIG